MCHTHSPSNKDILRFLLSHKKTHATHVDLGVTHLLRNQLKGGGGGGGEGFPNDYASVVLIKLNTYV